MFASAMYGIVADYLLGNRTGERALSRRVSERSNLLIDNGKLLIYIAAPKDGHRS
jgi:hypothetical protein